MSLEPQVIGFTAKERRAQRGNAIKAKHKLDSAPNPHLRASHVFQTQPTGRSKPEKMSYHDYMMKQLSSGTTTSHHLALGITRRPSSAPSRRRPQSARDTPEENGPLTSLKLLEINPDADKDHLDVEHYDDGIIAVVTKESEFPKRLLASGEGHTILQPNSSIHRYHNHTDITFETAIRPSSAGNNPRLIATARVAAPPYPACCAKRQCHVHYLEQLEKLHRIQKRDVDYEIHDRSRKIHNMHVNYDTYHGKLNAQTKLPGYRTIDPSQPRLMVDSEKKTTPLFIHTTRDAAFYSGIPNSKPLFC